METVKAVGKGILLVASLLAGAALTLWTGSGWALAATALVLTVPAGGWFWNRMARRGLTASVQALASAEKESPVTVSLAVRPGMLPPVGPVWAEILVENDLTGEKSGLRFPLQAEGDRWTGHITLKSAHCGRLRICLDALELWDPMGILRCRVPVGQNVKTAVIPDLFPVAWDPAKGICRDDTGESAPKRGEDRAEIYQLREYQPGDDVRGIHWKLSSKLDRLVWREPGSTASRSLLLDWDPGSAGPREADALAGAIFSLGCALTEAGIPYTLALRENGACRLEQITNSEELTERLSLVLRNRGGALSAPLPEFGTVLRFCTEAEDRGDGAFLLCCSEDRQPVDNGLWFPPEGCADALEQLEVAYG